MIKVYLTYKDVLHRPIEENTVKVERIQMTTRFNSTKSPCLGLGDLHLCFNTFSFPVVAADTHERPVILFQYVENLSITKEIRTNYDSQVFFH